MSDCKYVRDYYGVPAKVGMRIRYKGHGGIIYADGGCYVRANMDADKPGVTCNIHPTDPDLEYLEMGKIRKMTRSQERYQRYLEYGDGFDSFLQYIGWDSDPERSWNTTRG